MLSGQGKHTLSAAIYLWTHDAKIVISDVDGTITKSDVMGHIMPWIGSSWSHFGVAEFFTNINKNSYNLLYLTSRAIGQADATREYLFEEVGQQKGAEVHLLPAGPLIMSPESLLAAFHREVIQRRPHVCIPLEKDCEQKS